MLRLTWRPQMARSFGEEALPASSSGEPVHQRNDERLKQLPRNRLRSAGQAQGNREDPFENCMKLCGLYCEVLCIPTEGPARVQTCLDHGYDALHPPHMIRSLHPPGRHLIVYVLCPGLRHQAWLSLSVLCIIAAQGSADTGALRRTDHTCAHWFPPSTGCWHAGIRRRPPAPSAQHSSLPGQQPASGTWR